MNYAHLYITGIFIQLTPKFKIKPKFKTKPSTCKHDNIYLLSYMYKLVVHVPIVEQE